MQESLSFYYRDPSSPATLGLQSLISYIHYNNLLLAESALGGNSWL